MTTTITSPSVVVPPAVLEHITAIRHDLHQHPELGYEETRTSGVVQRELTRLGIPFKAGLAGGTGVLATIAGGAGAGPCVALRADMDALPIHEETGLPYASRTPGKMHACGHDGHTSILLGAAAVLKDLAPQISGTIKLLFQPAEEGGCGGRRMCEDGVLENPRVDAVFGLHGWPGLPVGMTGTRPGPLLASVDGFTITLTGRGSHAATPYQGIDPIVCGAALVQALQAVVARETDPFDPCVLSVSQFHAGSGFNVLPETAMLNGTIRALSTARRDAVVASLRRTTEHTAAAHGCRATIETYGTTPVTNNTPEMAAYVGQVSRQALGAKAFYPLPQPVMWGEDFAFYLEQAPGCFFALGLKPAGQSDYPMLHNPHFDFTDAALPVGVRMMCELALGMPGRAG